jgi:sortase A
VSLTLRLSRYASRLLLAIGVLTLGYAAWVAIDARLYQARELARMAQDRQAVLHARVPDAPPPVATPAPADGASIGEIRVPRLGLSVVVVQGESDAILQRAAGHLARTALPGAEGNVVLAGHRDTFFRPLKDIRSGDRITVATSQRDFEYVVESTRVVEPTEVAVIRPTGGRTLTLITCFPFYYVGPAPHRFIVFARETD